MAIEATCLIEGCPRKRHSDKCKCAYEACARPSRRYGYCVGHSGQIDRGEELHDLKYSRREPGQPCLTCGSKNLMPKSNQFCSKACDFLYRKFDGNVPAKALCGVCGIDIPLAVAGKRRVRATILLCRKHQRRVHLDHHIKTLSERDGTDCALCGEPIDVTKRGREPDSVSVDHKLPRSKGGSDEEHNLQLAHYRCNNLRGNKDVEAFRKEALTYRY